MALHARNIQLLPAIMDMSTSEAELRADLFHVLIYHQCRELLESTIDDMHGGIFGSMSQCPRKVGINVERALKWLTCISIHLAGLESGGSANPQRFMSFLFCSLLHTDVKCEAPKAREVIEQFGALDANAMTILVSEAALVELDIENHCITQTLASRLCSLRRERLEILEAALLDNDVNLARKISTKFLSRLASVSSGFTQRIMKP